MRSLNKLQLGIVALSLVLAGVTVYSFTQISTLLTKVNSLTLQITEKDEAINTIKTKTLEGTVVKIGYISASTEALETVKPFLEKIIVPDMNAYCKQIGKNVTFQFQIEDAQGQAAIHLEKVQELKKQGISVFIGGLWSSQACGSLNYVDNNHMLMLSYSSTSPTLNIADDRLFRFIHNDIYNGPVLAEMLWSYGIRHVCFIHRGDSWGDGILGLFKPVWKEKGGDILNTSDIVWNEEWDLEWVNRGGIRYNSTTIDFSDYLAIADQQISNARKKYSADSIGVILLAFDEAPLIISQAKDYPNIYSTKWFGADSTAKSKEIKDQVPEEANVMKLYSYLPSPPDNEQYKRLEGRYTALTGLPLTIYNAYLYDTSMIAMKAMLLADSDKADSIVNLLQPLCTNYYGVTGPCSLDTSGDREPPPCDIWGYGVVEGKVEFIRYGGIDPAAGRVSWDTGSR